MYNESSFYDFASIYPHAINMDISGIIYVLVEIYNDIKKINSELKHPLNFKIVGNKRLRQPNTMPKNIHYRYTKNVAFVSIREHQALRDIHELLKKFHTKNSSLPYPFLFVIKYPKLFIRNAREARHLRN